MPDNDNARADELLLQAQSRLNGAQTEAQLDAVKAAFIGRNGEIQKQLKQIGALPKEERPAAGAKVNQLREKFEELFAARQKEMRGEEIERRLNETPPDATLPGRAQGLGSLHPLTLAAERASEIFAAAGFAIADGPEIETDFYNFTALNHPPDHPARSMHDTFYTAGGAHLLRTHTSPVQVRYMLANTPPLRAIAPGRVYRCDHDATHSPMFHQIEGIWVDETVAFTDLKGVLGMFFRAFFEDDDIEVRFRPSYFPFTEPSAECDIRRKGEWLEVAGCGMMHPNVLKAGGVDASKHRGFAFGMGVERLAMLRWDIADIRMFFENDLRFLRQFAGE